MKKILLTLILCLCLFNVVAYDNGQKIWPTDSDIYKCIKSLYIIQGLALPSSSGPWSTNELLEMTKLLKDDGSDLYQYVMDELSKNPRLQPENGLGFNFGLDLNVESYIHSNNESFVGSENFVYDTLDMKPFLQFNWETYIADNFYGFFGLDMRNCFHGGSKGDIGATNVSTNILFFQDLTFNLQYLSFNFPQRAVASFGGNHWSVLIGKDRLSWGNGETGNFVISDTIPAHYLARFTAFYNTYKYSFLTSFFPHQLMYFNDNGWSDHGSQADPIQGIRFYMAHRLEGKFFGNKLSASLTEAIMYQSDDGVINPRIFNPVDCFHNYYIRSNANSTLVLEMDYTPIKHLNIYGQLIVDEFAMPGEPTGKNNSWAFPNALGYMLGAKTSFEVNKGIFYSSFETVKTDPFLYLRYNQIVNDAQEKDGYGINYVVGYSEFSSIDGTSYDEYFLGYKYGGDALVFNLNAGWNNYKNFSVEGNIFYMMHGTFDKWSNWTEIGDGSDPNVPKWDNFDFLTTSHPNYNNKDDKDAKSRNAISHTLICGVNATYRFNPTVKAFAQTDFIFVNNYGNHAGKKEVDFQLALGANITFDF